MYQPNQGPMNRTLITQINADQKYKKSAKISAISGPYLSMNELHEPISHYDAIRYKHGDLTEKIIGIFYDVYNVLGYGFLEKVYENALVIRLQLVNYLKATPYEVGLLLNFGPEPQVVRKAYDNRRKKIGRR